MPRSEDRLPCADPLESWEGAVPSPADDDAPIRRRVRKKKKRRRKNVSAMPPVGKIVLFCVAVLAAVVGLTLYSKTAFSWIIAFAVLIYLLGVVSVWHIAEQESDITSWLCRQLPFYQFYYAFTNFEIPQIRFGFYCQVTAVCMALAALCGHELREAIRGGGRSVHKGPVAEMRMAGLIPISSP